MPDKFCRLAIYHGLRAFYFYSGLLGVRNNKKRVKTIFFTCTVALDGFTLCV